MLRRCLILAGLALAAACGGPEEPLVPLVLDEGRRWPVDEHARLMFGRMTTAAEAVAPSATTAERAATGARLTDDIRDLIEGCTMSGPAHDQLHVLLSAYIPAVEALAEHGRAEDLELVRAHLTLYRDFFE